MANDSHYYYLVNKSDTRGNQNISQTRLSKGRLSNSVHRPTDTNKQPISERTSYLLTVLLNIKILYDIKSQYGNKLKHSLRILKKSRNVTVARVNNILPCHLYRNEKSNARKQIIFKSLLRGYPYRLQCFRGIEESIRNESQGGRKRYGSQAGTSIQRTLMKNNKSECLFFIITKLLDTPLL